MPHLLVLVRRHCDELSLFEDVCSEGAVRELEDVIGTDQVEAGLVLVHRVEDRLHGKHIVEQL